MPSHILSARDKKTWQTNKQNESHSKDMMSHSLMSCTKSTNCVNGRKGKPGDTS